MEEGMYSKAYKLNSTLTNMMIRCGSETDGVRVTVLDSYLIKPIGCNSYQEMSWPVVFPADSVESASQRQNPHPQIGHAISRGCAKGKISCLR